MTVRDYDALPHQRSNLDRLRVEPHRTRRRSGQRGHRLQVGCWPEADPRHAELRQARNRRDVLHHHDVDRQRTGVAKRFDHGLIPHPGMKKPEAPA